MAELQLEMFIVAVQDPHVEKICCWGFPTEESARLFMQKWDAHFPKATLTMLEVPLFLSLEDSDDVPDSMVN